MKKLLLLISCLVLFPHQALAICSIEEGCTGASTGFGAIDNFTGAEPSSSGYVHRESDGTYGLTEGTQPNSEERDYFGLKQDYGAIGDGVADDTDAIDNFIAALFSNKGVCGYIEHGNYKHSGGRLLIDFAQGAANIGVTSTRVAPCIIGAGIYNSTIDLTGAPTDEGPQFHIYNTSTENGGTAVGGVFKDFGILCDTDGTCASVGLESLADNLGNINFENIFFSNLNTTSCVNAVTLKINYVFDTIWKNIITVGKVGYGKSLGLFNAVFNQFIGGSFSNAGTGVYVHSGQSLGNVFLGSDIENVNFGYKQDSCSSYGNTWTGGFIDQWRPDLGTYGTGYPFFVNCSYDNGHSSSSLDITNVVVTDRSKTPWIDPGHNANITYRGFTP